MTARDEVLQHHSLLVRDGRILDILPTPLAAETYAAGAVLSRASHLLLPGLINADARSARTDSPGNVLLAIAQMLRSGITSFADRYSSPRATLFAAQDQGMRVVIGMPVADSAQYFSRALELRDEYRGHPLVSTAFAPLAANLLQEATFSKLITLADELDARIVMQINGSLAEVRECEALHGMRPMQRLWKLGLLTPALNAVHMTVAGEEDIALAQRTGVSITLCPQVDLHSGNGLPPAEHFLAAGISLGLGSAYDGHLSFDIRGDMKLLALMTRSPWDALAAATRGGAAILGLESEVGTLQAGKWADLCCVELDDGAERVVDPLHALVFGGGRDMTDVWVAGRQLLSQRELTRLDRSTLAAGAA